MIMIMHVMNMMMIANELQKGTIENINAGLFTLALSGGCDDTRGKCSYGEFVVRNIIAIAIIIFIINVNVKGFPFLKININLLR